MNRAGCGIVIAVVAGLLAIGTVISSFSKEGINSRILFAFMCAGVVVWVVLAHRR